MSTKRDAWKQSLVLVVDDDPVQRMPARATLEQAGFSVEEAEDGAEALRILENCQPDLILLDVNMPGIDGFSVCEQVRATPATQHTPILMMTGLEDVESINRAYEVGATDFITKPINWLLLRYRSLYILRSSRSFSELHTSQERLSNAQRIARLGNWEWDVRDREISYSDEILRIFGFEAREGGYPRSALRERIHHSDRSEVESAVERCLRERQPLDLDIRIDLSDGSERVAHLEAHAILDENGEPIRLEGTLQDITERKRAEEEIRHLAFHDSLTGLANRRLLRELLVHAVTRGTRDKMPFALLYLDLDDFKRVNDTLGHPVGDLFLKGVAERLTQSVRMGDWVARPSGEEPEMAVARLGGDEFAIILTHVRDPQAAAVAARRILTEFSKPFLISGHELTAGASIGITVWPDDGADADTLLRNADAAMYHAKERGKNHYQFYAKSMNAQTMHQVFSENKLRGAIDRSELRVFYQPKVVTETGKIAGMEALVRWEHPEMGLIEPGHFIPLAEDTRLIVPLGAWVLRKACAQTKKWIESGLTPRRVAVNFSAHQFHDPDLLTTIRDALAEVDLAGRYLEVEITETTLMQDVEAAAKLLRNLNEEEITVAIDDFGTGYSSLRYLREFPVNTLKIDGSFIRDITTDREAAEITSAIISMAKSLRIKVVAEGVETQAQWDFLRERGCDEIQGYVFSKPLPVEEFERLLRAHEED